MDWLVVLLSGGGLLAASLAFVIWRLVKRSNQLELERAKNARLEEEIAGLKRMVEIYSKPRPVTWDDTVDRL